MLHSDLVKKVNNEITFYEWRKILLYQCLVDKEFESWLNKLLSFDSWEYDKFNLLVNGIIEEYQYWFSKCSNDYLISIRIESLFGLVEVLTEHSRYIQNLIAQLKKDLGENFWGMIQFGPSCYDTINTKYGIEVLSRFKIYCRCIELQTTQNQIFERVLKEFFISCESKYLSEESDYKDITNARIRYYFSHFCGKVIPLNLIADFITTGMGLDSGDLNQIIGGKAIGLAKLYNFGVDIPQAYVVPIGINLKQCDIEKAIENKLAKYSVRSSANIEDGDKASFAGLFKTYLNVDFDDLFNRYLNVCDSVQADCIYNYCKTKCIDKQLHMAVILQEMVEPDCAGVFFYTSQKSIIEVVLGLGDGLVSGQKVDLSVEVNESHLCDLTYKEIKIKAVLLKQLFCIAKQTKCNCDIEFAIKDEKIFFLQLRPITTEISYGCTVSTDNKIGGIVASQGHVIGDCIFIDSLEDLTNWKEQGILLTWYIGPEWTDLILKSKGVVVGNGGFLSHAAIVSREHKIPCIVNIGNENVTKLKKYRQIDLNATDGFVEGIK